MEAGRILVTRNVTIEKGVKLCECVATKMPLKLQDAIYIGLRYYAQAAIMLMYAMVEARQ